VERCWAATLAQRKSQWDADRAAASTIVVDLAAGMAARQGTKIGRRRAAVAIMARARAGAQTAASAMARLQERTASMGRRCATGTASIQPPASDRQARRAARRRPSAIRLRTRPR